MSRESIKWVPCTSPEVGDILRWVEPIWAPPSKARGKPNKKGDQQVIAEVIDMAQFIALEVISVEKVAGGGQLKVKAGEVIRRKLSSLEMGDCRKQVVQPLP